MNIWNSISRKRAAAGAAAAIVLVVPAAAGAATSLPAPTPTCATPQLSQAFAAWGDHNWYTLAPGQDVDGFVGTGWSLSAGAHTVLATLQDGSSGEVLDLPSGATAVSPVICIATNFPLSKAMVRSIAGPPGLTVEVSYLDSGRISRPGNVPSTASWAPSVPMQLWPSNTSGWQQIRLVYHATGTRNEYQLYNLYIDPRCA